MAEKEYIPALKYDWLTRFYDPILRITMPEKQFKTDLVNQANIKENHRVLDFGCGSLTLTLLAKQNQPKAELTGVDVDEKNIAIARQKLEREEAEIKIDKYDGVILPYPDGYFDRVITSLVFHHLTKGQKKNSLKEIKRVLKTGGELHIADWGKAKNGLMRFLFYSVQLLDGFETTTDNVYGLLPTYIAETGFLNVKTNKHYNTIFGTLSLHSAMK